MPDWEKEYQEAKKTIADHEKKIKELEQRLNAQYDKTEEILKRLGQLERKAQSAVGGS